MYSSFLTENATPAQLRRAIAANHTEWFTTESLQRGGDIHREPGLTWTVSPHEAVLAFPRRPAAVTGPELDRILCQLRESGTKGASCWALAGGPRGLGVRLLARGFEWGWRPHWMALDLQTDLAPPPAVEGVTLSIEEEEVSDAPDLPYYSPENARVWNALAHASPRRDWRFVARRNGLILGHTLLFLPGVTNSVGGIYNMGTVAAARRMGVGQALIAAAGAQARALGCRWLTLNSAADAFYRRCGFTSLGHGQTWWMHAPTLATPPPAPERVAFAEAVGLGDTDTLDRLPSGALPDNLDAPLAGGTPPLQIAIHTRKLASARWLVAHGATLSVVDAWDLGWKSRATAMLKREPDRVNDRLGADRLTPLHVAAERGDLELARLLLTASPDLTLTDDRYHGTPVGWAFHCGHPELHAALLQAAQG